MSNGRQIGSIVGSLIAAYFTAGTSYAAFAVAAGGAIGGAIGGELDPQKIYGPRLDDTKISISTYGAVIPRIYGTFRSGGIVVWCTDRQEVVKEEDQGKGGSGVEQTSYSYYVHMRVLLCERPADGHQVNVVRIFQDGKLVWDATSGISIGQALATAESPLSSAVLYQGDENQLPDPYEEMFDGVGNAPPFRDFVSISLRNVDCPGGRVPQFSFVFSASSTVGNQTEHFSNNGGAYAGLIMSDRVYSLVQNVNTLSTYLGGPDYFNLDKVMGLPSSMLSFYPRPLQDAEKPMVVRITTNGTSYQIYLVDIDAGIITIVADIHDDSLGFYQYGSAAYDQALGNLAIGPGQATPIIVFNSLANASKIVTCATPIGNIGAIAIYNDVVYALVMGPLNIVIQMFSAEDGSNIATHDTGIQYGTGGFLNFSRSTITATASGIFCYLVDSAYAGHLVRFNGSTFEELAYSVFGGDEPGIRNEIGTLLTMFCDGRRATVGPFLSDNDYKTLFLNRVTTSDIKVKDVIAAEMDRIGESRYSVAGIPDSDVIAGFGIASQASTRAAIEPLKTAFQIFQVDEDGLIKFKKYKDITALDYVSYDELGFSADGSGGDVFPLQRTQEIDLPRSVTVNYIQPGLDFNVANEPERRQTTGSIQDVSVELAIAMSSNVAKAAAQAILYSAWNAQNTRQASVARKFAYLSPGDGVNIEYPRGTVGLWRITSFNDDGRVIQWTVEPGDAALFSKIAIGTTGFNGQVMASVPPPTMMDIVDGPILQDADNNAGLYIAMGGAGVTGWNGAELWAGNDDATLESQGTVRNAAVRGFAENALGNFSLGIMDGINSLTVNVGEGELSSATRAALDANSGLNAFALGINGRWEYCQFMTATDLGNAGVGRRYTLSGLIRGARGTIHNRGNHAANDRFLMLGYAGTLRPASDNSEIGQSKYYRAVSQGRSINSAASQVYANTGEGLMPFAPWDARKSKAATNDQTIDWQRCTRLSTNAFRGIVPLGEASQSWVVEFYTSSGFTTVAGTLTSTTNSLTITSAQQTSFGLTPGGTLFVRIYQVSDVVGRGHYLQATL